jgi:predicted DNA-binding transcriptional regulator YafY
MTSDNVVIDYTNHAGVRGSRQIRPLPEGFRWGSTEWHPEPQWLLDAYDVAKDDLRTFAVKDIHAWAPKDTATGRAMDSVFKQLQRSIEKNGLMVKRLRELLQRIEFHQPTHETFDASFEIERILREEGS